jgi:CheY-like chemotaxis protein
MLQVRGEAVPTFLVAEDTENDVILLRHAFAKAGLKVPLNVVRDGQEAIDYLKDCRTSGALPALLLLDIHMPKYDGFEVLQWIREQPGLRRLVVIIFTTSSLPADMNRAYDLGANAFLTKPIDIGGLADLMTVLYHFWVRFNKRPVCVSS